ncbi:MAG: CDP-alcohol phosphatidyltransferase family protein [Aestuariivirga sp.]
MNPPNLITIARILLVPFTVWLILSEAYGFAFLAFAAAGISDGVDGYIARRYNLRTELGAYLDPMADKALLVSVYVTLGVLKVLPSWLVILVVSRDVLIVGAFLLSWQMNRPVQIRPSMLSKINTTGQIVLIAVVLGAAEMEIALKPWLLAGMGIVGVLTAASGGLYLFDWVRHMANGRRGNSST